jgi:hypothetical protein
MAAAAAVGVSCAALDGTSSEVAGRRSSPDEIGVATAERKAAMAALIESRRADPAALSALLAEMPKGADLHSHLSGAVPTRQLVEWGRSAALCLVPGDFTLVKQSPCPDDTAPLATLADSDPLYEQLVAAWSMAGQSLEPLDDSERRAALGARHAHFFDAFLKFYPVTRDSTAQMIAEVRRASARERVGHVELMVAFGTSAAGRTAASIFAGDPQWSGSWDTSTPAEAWEAKYTAVRAKLGKRLAPQVAELEEWEAEAGAVLHCDAQDGTRDAGCDVDVRYLVQLNRTQTREHVFGQLVYALELARADDAGADRIVGLNLALAEENESSLRTYEDTMFSIAILRGIARRQHPDEPPPRIALHAGELVPELLAEDGSDDRHLGFHIRDAVRYAGEPIADRIGHGTDIEREDPDGTLRAEMAERGVLVEACLTSNDWLLDVRGATHPLKSYLEAGVPVALATDDAGVFGTTLTDELRRAVELHGLGYPALEQMARSSIEHAFLPGAPLEDDADCAEALALERLEPEELPAACAELVRQSPRARARWAFERALVAFERAHVPPAAGEP